MKETKEREKTCEYTVKRQSMNQEASSHSTLNLLAPWSWNSQLPELGEIKFLLLYIKNKYGSMFKCEYSILKRKKLYQRYNSFLPTVLATAHAKPFKFLSWRTATISHHLLSSSFPLLALSCVQHLPCPPHSPIPISLIPFTLYQNHNLFLSCFRVGIFSLTFWSNVICVSCHIGTEE